MGKKKYYTHVERSLQAWNVRYKNQIEQLQAEKEWMSEYVEQALGNQWQEIMKRELTETKPKGGG